MLAVDPRVQRAASPMLFHPDLRKTNIFVSEEDPTKVTDIIDWQSSSIRPIVEYAEEKPDFAATSYKIYMDNEPQLVDVIGDLCQKAYEGSLQILVPELAYARSLPLDLVRPFEYCHKTWLVGAAAMRQELTFLSRRCQELGLPGSCPYPLPTPEEWPSLEEEEENWKASLKLEAMLEDYLNAPDGWVPAESWAEAKAKNVELLEDFKNRRTDKENGEAKNTSAEELRKIWPFDLP